MVYVGITFKKYRRSFGLNRARRRIDSADNDASISYSPDGALASSPRLEKNCIRSLLSARAFSSWEDVDDSCTNNVWYIFSKCDCFASFSFYSARRAWLSSDSCSFSLNSRTDVATSLPSMISRARLLRFAALLPSGLYVAGARASRPPESSAPITVVATALRDVEGTTDVVPDSRRVVRFDKNSYCVTY
jgi:hypothetical protein